MKKLIAFVIAAMMVLSMIPVMAFTVSADEETYSIPDPDEGFWSTYRNPGQYDLAEGEHYVPTAGYQYTTEGFKTIAPEYVGNFTPNYTVQTSAPVDLDDGFYMQFRIDDFSYKGESGTEDEWICISISDRRLVNPGDVKYGNNWLVLMRGTGEGSTQLEPHTTVQTVDGKVGTFTPGTFVQAEVPMDGDGKEIYDFAIAPDGAGAYTVTINGVAIGGMDAVSEHIGAFEECYIGVTFHSGQKGGTAAMTILKQGSSADTAETPSGTSSKAPEVSGVEVAPIADPSTVEANKPAIIFDGDLTSSYSEPSCSGCALSKTANNTWKLTASGAVPYLSWSIRNDISYAAEDFPVFAMMLKNFTGSDGGVYYCAGDVVSATDANKTDWTQWDEYDEETKEGTSKFYSTESDEYVLITVDLTDLWSGRINSIRPHFGIDLADELQTEFDIDYMGFFRSIEEAMVYGDAYAEQLGGSVVTTPDTEAPAADDDETTAAGDETTVADTNKPTTDVEGCASVVGFTSAAVLLAAAAAVALKKKD